MKVSLTKSAVLTALIMSISLSSSAVIPIGWVFNLSGQGEFMDLPFPTELRRQPDGSLKMDDFPNPRRIKTVDRTKRAVADGYGYSTAPTIYFKFNGAIFPDSIPTAAASREPGAAIFLIDIDPTSPERGRRFPLDSRFHAKPGYMGSARNLLAMMPVPGFVLRENTLYAAGVTTALETRTGPLHDSPDLDQLARGVAPDAELGERALELYGPALETLAELGLDPDRLAALTVFRTGDPTVRMRALFDGVTQLDNFEFEAPLKPTRDYPLYSVLEGRVMMPQFQDGEPPYANGKGGRIHFDADGRPVIQRWEPVPVAFSVPKGLAPAAGFPIMIYIHGTAGVSTQFIDRGEETGQGGPETRGALRSNLGTGLELAEPGTGPAMIYARRGIAGVGAAQQHAGERGGSSTQLGFYNFFSPEALRDNLLQATAEASFLLRLVKQIEIDPSLCPETDTASGPITFDPHLIFGMGQSLGSLILGPWGAVETDLKALIPAGNGAYWSIFMADGNAADAKFFRRKGEGQGTWAHLDRFHPFISLMANVLAESDPFAYQPHYLERPFPGRSPKHVWAAFGLYDHYFIPDSQNAAILCMGLDFAGPALEDSTPVALELAGLRQLPYPISANKRAPGGMYTAVAVQFEQKGPIDGHHVNYQREDAKYQYGCFLESLVKTGIPVVYEPKDQWDAPCGD